MKREFPCVESITKFYARVRSDTDEQPDPKRPHRAFLVRVWREEEEVNENYNLMDIAALVASKVWESRNDLVRAIAAMPRVNAVEAIEDGWASGAGIVVYVEWP